MGAIFISGGRLGHHVGSLVGCLFFESVGSWMKLEAGLLPPTSRCAIKRVRTVRQENEVLPGSPNLDYSPTEPRWQLQKSAEHLICWRSFRIRAIPLSGATARMKHTAIGRC
jgi:hypothetical protein